MPGIKVIEVIASSEKGIVVAIQNVVAEVTRALHTNDSVFTKDMQVAVIETQISTSVVICKISFRLDEDTAAK